MGVNVPVSAIQKEGGVFNSKINIVKGALDDAKGHHRSTMRAFLIMCVACVDFLSNYLSHCLIIYR